VRQGLPQSIRFQCVHQTSVSSSWKPRYGDSQQQFGDDNVDANDDIPRADDDDEPAAVAAELTAARYVSCRRVTQESPWYHANINASARHVPKKYMRRESFMDGSTVFARWRQCAPPRVPT